MPRLGEVLLDRRQLLEAASVLRQRLLERAVLEELLPVDLPRLLFGLARYLVARVRLLVHVRLGPLWLGRGLAAFTRAGTLGLVVGEDRIVVELLPDLVDELEPGQLQQANRLLQLRRHDQLLRQAELLLDFH